MKKQIRLGTGPNDKARLSTIAIRQLEEICQVTGQPKNAVIQEALLMYYTEMVHEETKRQLAQLQKAYDELYAHHCEVINQ